MARMSDHHQTLNQEGEGKCSVPMFSQGAPAGFCDDPAYGKRPPGETYHDDNGKVQRFDGKYSGMVSALACPRHGGPEFRTFMNGDKWCAAMPDFEDLQVSPSGFGDTREEAIAELKKDKSIAMPVLTTAFNDAVRFRWWARSSLQLFKIKSAIHARIDLGDYLEFERRDSESDLEIIRRIADHFIAAERAEQEGGTAID
ncbi:hypothetical protein LCGC14_0734770 [marine sediment metagenome]|uniref:Uncharacterized protein n=1 Tax=marine sediment metagenome TaxID=412755 RepID=A0A0F9Q8N9_9ZZZZ